LVPVHLRCAYSCRWQLGPHNLSRSSTNAGGLRASALGRVFLLWLSSGREDKRCVEVFIRRPCLGLSACEGEPCLGLSAREGETHLVLCAAHLSSPLNFAHRIRSSQSFAPLFCATAPTCPSPLPPIQDDRLAAGHPSATRKNHPRVPFALRAILWAQAKMGLVASLPTEGWWW
jgi:hypothetical protein